VVVVVIVVLAHIPRSLKQNMKLNCHKNNQNAINAHNKERQKKNKDKKLLQFFMVFIYYFISFLHNVIMKVFP
jgi:hypothetical protein